MKLLVSALPLFLIAVPVSAGTKASDTIFDHWVTEAGDGIVEIKICEDQRPCGISKWVHPENGVLIDTKNPDANLKDRPLLGSKIIWGFKPKENRWTGGKIYNPRDGKTYNSKLALTEDDKLKVKGCVGPICKSLIWTRAEEHRVAVMTAKVP